jgi:hypothetical protein
MTAFHSHLNPAVIFQQIDQFVNFHLESLHAMQKSRIDMTHNVRAKLPAEAGAVSPVRDNSTAGADRAYSACRSGSA